MASTDEYGPVELITIGFTTEQPPAAVVDAILELDAEHTVSILDLIVVSRDVEGAVTVVELEEHDESSPLSAIALALAGLLAEEDVILIAETLPPESSALIVAVELSWARRLANAIDDADATVLSQDRIPGSVITDAALALQPNDN